MTLFDSQGNYLVPPELPLATRTGRLIPNEQRTEAAPERMQAAMQIVTANHPTASLRSLRSTYDCMGMVFANRRTWVDIEHLETFLIDDGYRQISDNELKEGDLVVYRDESYEPTHVGIVQHLSPYKPDQSRDVYVLSQWGRDGEYFHRIDDVNHNLGTPTEYWTDRT